MRLTGTLDRLRSHLRRQISLSVIRRSTAGVENSIPADGIGILVDSNVHSHTVTHETAWISTGQKAFGPKVRSTGYAARVPIYKRGSKSTQYIEVCYLASIARLVQLGHAKLWTSHHLMLERDPQPRARYADTGWYDFNLFGRGDLESIDGDPYDRVLMSPFSPNTSCLDDIGKQLASSRDALYLSLLKVMGTKNSQDAWHIRTAEIFGLHCFLTMDKKLLNIIYSQRKTPVISSLRTKVLSPAMLGKSLGIKPIELHHFDNEEASYPVRSDLHWEGEKRPTTRRKNR